MGYRALAGRTCNTAGDLGVWPERLGRFLYDLHMVPPEFVGMRTVSAETEREVRNGEWLRLYALTEPHLVESERRAAATVVGRAFDDETAWRFAPCVNHGDLGPEHVLVTPAGDLSGVLDWEEVGVGDPAVDFAWWLQATPTIGERALAAYGGAPDAGFAARARLAFVLMPLHELEYGLAVDRPDIIASALTGFHERLPILGEPR